jgi:hypothetical protein
MVRKSTWRRTLSVIAVTFIFLCSATTAHAAGDSFETAEPIFLHQSVTESLDENSASQFYTFTIDEAASYTLFTTGDTDSRATLYNSAYQAIASNDQQCSSLTTCQDYPFQLNFEISHFLEAGTYYLEVSWGAFDWGGEAGEYRLILDQELDVAVDFGQSYSAAMSGSGTDIFTFSLDQTTTLYVTTSGEVDTALSYDFTPAEGDVSLAVTVNSDYSGENGAAIFSSQAFPAGTYIFYVNSENNSTGLYQFSINNDIEPNGISVGEDIYGFEGQSIEVLAEMVSSHSGQFRYNWQVIDGDISAQDIAIDNQNGEYLLSTAPAQTLDNYYDIVFEATATDVNTGEVFSDSFVFTGRDRPNDSAQYNEAIGLNNTFSLFLSLVDTTGTSPRQSFSRDTDYVPFQVDSPSQIRILRSQDTQNNTVAFDVVDSNGGSIDSLVCNPAYELADWDRECIANLPIGSYFLKAYLPSSSSFSEPGTKADFRVESNDLLSKPVNFDLIVDFEERSTDGGQYSTSQLIIEPDSQSNNPPGLCTEYTGNPERLDDLSDHSNQHTELVNLVGGCQYVITHVVTDYAINGEPLETNEYNNYVSADISSDGKDVSISLNYYSDDIVVSSDSTNVSLTNTSSLSDINRTITVKYAATFGIEGVDIFSDSELPVIGFEPADVFVSITPATFNGSSTNVSEYCDSYSRSRRKSASTNPTNYSFTFNVTAGCVYETKFSVEGNDSYVSSQTAIGLFEANLVNGAVRISDSSDQLTPDKDEIVQLDVDDSTGIVDMGLVGVLGPGAKFNLTVTLETENGPANIPTSNLELLKIVLYGPKGEVVERTGRYLNGMTGFFDRLAIKPGDFRYTVEYEDPSYQRSVFSKTFTLNKSTTIYSTEEYFEYANMPPVASAGNDTTYAEGELVMLSGQSSTDSDGAISTYQWQQISGPTVQLLNSSSATPTFSAPDVKTNTVFTFQLVVTDDEGLASDPAEVSITVTPVNTSPVITIVGGNSRSVVEGDTITLDATNSSDPDANSGESLSYYWESLTPGFTLTSQHSATQTFVTDDSFAEIQLKLTVTDADYAQTQNSTGLVEETITISVNRRPDFRESSIPTSINEEANYSAVPAFDDLDGDTIANITVTGLPTWLRWDDASNTLVGTPDDKDVGLHSNIYISATDSAGTSSEPFGPITIEVTSINDTPIINNLLPSATATIEQIYSYDMSVVDNDNNEPGKTVELTYNIVNKPSWATFSNGVLTGTPQVEDIGIYEGIEIAVTDNVIDTALKVGPFAIEVLTDGKDREKPVITNANEESRLVIPADDENGINRNNTALLDYFANITVKDNVDVDITYQINGLPAANESENVFVPIGIHTVTLTASDESGNEAEVVTFTVEVSDQDAPVISLEGASSLSIAYGESYIEPGYKAMDNVDGDITERVEVTGEVGSEIGDYTLKYNVTDEAGNDAEEVLRTITIVDLAAPVLSIPQDIIVAAVDAKGAPASTESITTFLNAATATDLVDGVVDVTVSVEDGEGNRAEIPENFPLGETNVVFSASDFATPSNTTELVAVVSVRDLTKPVLTLVNPGSITVSLGSEYIDPGYNAVDNVDGDITAKVVLEGAVDTSSLANYPITYTVQDAAGNTATASRIVTVQDINAPVVSAPSNIVVAAVDASGTPISNSEIGEFLDAATASDAVDGSVNVTNDAPNVFPLGNTTVTFTATDSSDLTGTAQAVVTVEDMTPPNIELYGDTEVNLFFGSDYVEPGFSATDNVDGDVTDRVIVSGSVGSDLGQYSLTYAVVDNAENTAIPVHRIVNVVSGDNDTDNDGYTDKDENDNGTSYTDPSSVPPDFDKDFVSDLNDDDDDNDTVPDTEDAFPFDPAESIDSDDDGVGDNSDAYPFDNSRWQDTTAPVFGNVPGLVEFEASGEFTSVSLVELEVSDDAGEAVVVEVNNPGPYPLGDTEIQWTATDESGNSATVLQTVRIVDTTPPEISAMERVVIDARGRLTQIGLADIGAEVYDVVDSNVVISLSGPGALSSGIHNVTLTAADFSGNTASQNVEIAIVPWVTLPLSVYGEAGASISIPVQLSGEAPDYPVTVTANLTGFNSSSESLTINAGMSGTLSLVLPDDVSSDDTLWVELASAENAVNKGNLTQVLVVEENVPPTVKVSVSQDNVATRHIDPEGDEVVIHVDVSDLNMSDTHEVNFFSATLGELGTGDSISIPASALTAGSNVIEVSVLETNTSDTFVTLVEVDVFKLSNVPVLSGDMDSDGDGVSDIDEGLADSDGDGVADYLDDNSDPTSLPVEGTKQTIAVAPGLSLQVGSLAAAVSNGQPSTASVDLEELLEITQSDIPIGFVPIEPVFDFVVSGLSKPGDTVVVVLPLTTAIPDDATYLKYSESYGWYAFVDDGVNTIMSAGFDPDGNCPVAASPDYKPGLTSGDTCIRLTIQDGGIYDTDEHLNGRVADPGAIASIRSNMAPVISLDGELTRPERETVQLDASASSDADGDPLTFAWTQLSGQSVILQNPDESIASFVAPDVTATETLVFQVEVSDGIATESKSISIFVENVNRAPTVSASTSVSLAESGSTTVSATATDPDGDPLTYKWEQVSGPSLTLSNENSPTVTIVAPEVDSNSTASIKLTVSDGALSEEITVTITITNSANPINRPPEKKSSGSMSLQWLMLLVAMVLWRCYSRYRLLCTAAKHK